MSRGRVRTPTLAAAAAVLVGFALPASAPGATVAPNTTLDQFGTGAECSLREAVNAVDNQADFDACVKTGPAYGTTDTIRLAPGTYTLQIPPGAGEDEESGDLNLITFAALEIVALPGGPVVIDGNGTDRIIQYSADLTLRGISITGGLVGDPEPGFGVTGGAIAPSGGSELHIVDGAVFGNQADSFGGAIVANGPTSLTNVTMSDNATTDGAGGAIDVSGGTASLMLDHVTITGNRSEVNDPSQSSVAGGVSVQVGAPVTAHNSVIAGNTDASDDFDAPDCQGTITSTGGNVLGDTTGCTFTSMPSDSIGSPALLDPLVDNGGLTLTHALMNGSPALERGVAPCLPADQRGYPRPSPVGGQCDSGAYEQFTCASGPLNQPGPFAGCPQPAQPAQPGVIPQAKKKKCKKKRKKRAKGASKKRCKKKRKKR